jgi:putative transposase
MTIRPELIDELLQDYTNPQDLISESGLLKQLTKALVERCLETEMDVHLDNPEYQQQGKAKSNRRNGRSQKHLKGEFGKVEIGVPRDRNSEYEPQIVKKGQTRWDGFDDKILSLYARGMTTRDIQAQLQDMYGVEISHSLISQVTDSVMDEVRSWQSRPLSPVYPIVWLDALVVKVRENGRVINKAVHLALGVTLTGEKELLGIWMTGNEGAKFWMSVLTELKNRGVQDIFIACVDGLTGFPDAITTTFPRTQVQLCMVHLMRNSLSYVSYKHRKELAADLKLVYRASTEDEALLNLELFAEKWDKQYPTISRSWQEHWSHIMPMFTFPEEIRRVIYTTNAIESMNMTLRKVTRNHRIFPNDEAAQKVIYLAIQNISKKWTMPIRDWKPALNRFAIEFGDRLPKISGL